MGLSVFNIMTMNWNQQKDRPRKPTFLQTSRRVPKGTLEAGQNELLPRASDNLIGGLTRLRVSPSINGEDISEPDKHHTENDI